MLNQLKQRMQGATASLCKKPLPEAAVLIPVTDHPDGPELILTQRSANLSTHAGEVAFPGGKRDKEDHSLIITALRESEEEVGLPADSVEVLGQLKQRQTRFGLKVTPVVGIVDHTIPLTPNEGELDSVFNVPLSFFLNTPPNYQHPIDYLGHQMIFPAYEYDGYIIWGLTALMIADLLGVAFDTNVTLEASRIAPISPASAIPTT